MFSNLLIGFLFGLGVGGWVFSKAQHRNGGLTNQSLLVAAIVGFITLLVVSTVLGMVIDN